MGPYERNYDYELARAGYQVTTLKDTAVTVDFLTTQLNNYTLIIWRTNAYTYRHVEYWYVGETANSATENKYQNDFAQGWLNANAGILGVSLNFFSSHFPVGSLNKVKLILLIASDSDAVSFFLIHAGAQAVVFANGQISLGFGLIDDLTTGLLSYLASGQTLYNAMYNLVSPFVNAQPKDPLDNSYSPPFWYTGDGTLTLK